MRRCCKYLAVVSCLSSAALFAQEVGGNAPAAEPPAGVREGVRLYNATFFSDYYSNGLPVGVSSFGTGVQSDVDYGGSLAMGWLKNSPHVTAQVSYSPSYTGRVRYSNLHSLGHNLNANFNFHLSPKWTFNVNTTGMIQSLDRTMFIPSQASRIAATPATINGLSSALVSGEFLNPQLGAIVAAPPLANTVLAPILYGDRYLSAGISTGLVYARSDRFHISMNANGVRSQPLSVSGLPSNVANTTASRVGIRSTYANVSVGMGYGLTQRLSLNANWGAQRAFQNAQFGGAYTNWILQTGQAALGYMAGAKWFFTVGGGMGFGLQPQIKAATATAPSQTGRRYTYLANGSVAYKLYAQNFVASVSRTITSLYGLGGSETLMGDLGRNWNRPGSAWGLRSDLSYQSLSGRQGISSNLTGWRGTVGVHRMLSRRLSMAVDYSIMRNTGVYSLVNYGLTRNSARLMLVYSFANQMGPLNDQNF